MGNEAIPLGAASPSMSRGMGWGYHGFSSFSTSQIISVLLGFAKVLTFWKDLENLNMPTDLL